MRKNSKSCPFIIFGPKLAFELTNCNKWHLSCGWREFYNTAVHAVFYLWKKKSPEAVKYTNYQMKKLWVQTVSRRESQLIFNKSKEYPLWVSPLQMYNDGEKPA